MPELNVHSILVTGSNRGIGLELVRQLAGKINRPEWIFATCRDPEGPRAQALKNLAAKYQGIEIIPLVVVTERLKGAGLNLLINNAGIVKQSTLESETPEDMLEVYNTNVIGPMMVTQKKNEEDVQSEELTNKTDEGMKDKERSDKIKEIRANLTDEEEETSTREQESKDLARGGGLDSMEEEEESME
ncbi:hypothetical protein JD844_000299 [Phrynosoma platyrhinos]|uniref:Uncharacterized protein n=1 Tax=Phrynosoma platyrhinos TaxID=52577 RepID=A0ABQ7SQE0_PHRPL|nr:hypothetical protein JD844_000299 [Phrynosoma platyrhinos]